MTGGEQRTLPAPIIANRVALMPYSTLAGRHNFRMVTVALALLLCQQALDLKPVATLKEAAITEMSGIAKSRQFKDTYWVHNDSGDSARIFALRADGKSISPAGGIKIDGAVNHDWEDIAVEGKTLYISDLGNNGNKRKDLAIYQVDEPDPSKDTSVKVTKKIPVAYPDQTEFPPSGALKFDCEAIFCLRGKVYIITKHRVNKLLPDISANLYRLDTMNTDSVNKPVKIDSASNLSGWVTAADVSPNGKQLAVLTNFPGMSVWICDTSAAGDRFFSGGSKRQILLKNIKQAEAVCWKDDSTLIIGNEQGELFELPASKR